MNVANIKHTIKKWRRTTSISIQWKTDLVRTRMCFVYRVIDFKCKMDRISFANDELLTIHSTDEFAQFYFAPRGWKVLALLPLLVAKRPPSCLLSKKKKFYFWKRFQVPTLFCVQFMFLKWQRSNRITKNDFSSITT